MRSYYQVRSGAKAKSFRTEFFARRYYERLGNKTKALYYWQEGKSVLLCEYFKETYKPVWY